MNRKFFFHILRGCFFSADRWDMICALVEIIKNLIAIDFCIFFLIRKLSCCFEKFVSDGLKERNLGKGSR